MTDGIQRHVFIPPAFNSSLTITNITLMVFHETLPLPPFYISPIRLRMCVGMSITVPQHPLLSPLRKAIFMLITVLKLTPKNDCK